MCRKRARISERRRSGGFGRGKIGEEWKCGKSEDESAYVAVYISER